MSYVARTQKQKPPYRLSTRYPPYDVGEKVNVLWPNHPTGTHRVRTERAHADGKSTEYQLETDDTQVLYENGAWVHERHLGDV
jgi:hypothetical protein